MVLSKTFNQAHKNLLSDNGLLISGGTWLADHKESDALVKL